MMEHRPGTEPAGDDGELIGRDPRAMTPAELRALGHAPMPPAKAIRARCLDCCGGAPSEVRKCTATKCPAWPFRMGMSPWRAKRTVSPATLAALAAAREKSSLAEAKIGDAAPSGTDDAPTLADLLRA